MAPFIPKTYRALRRYVLSAGDHSPAAPSPLTPSRKVPSMDGSPDIETADIMRLLGEYHEILSHIGPTYGWAFRELMERIEKQMGVSPQRPPAETSDMVGAPASVLGEAFL